MNIIDSIIEFPSQCEQAWSETCKLDFSLNWDVENIILCGMGGSALGAHILQSSGAVNRPLIINNNYNLPFFANNNTLVILASYSGNTEEVLSCALEAKSRNCKIIGITTGGKLSKWLTENEISSYVYNPKYNLTGQPRFGLGYSLLGLAGIFHKLSLVNGNYSDFAVKNAILTLIKDKGKIILKAQEASILLKDKSIYIFTSDYLTGNAHLFANQLNETSKSFASYFIIPEANHHFLEGLKHPLQKCAGVFLGKYYSGRVLKRIKITKEILKNNNWDTFDFSSKQSEPFVQILETILFSSLTSAYLAIHYGEDPASIPTVDYFKEKMGSE